MNAADSRLTTLEEWVVHDLGRRVARIEVASADASFRRYFRIVHPDGSTLIAMDAPPDKEDIRPYLKVAGLLQSVGVHVPQVHAVDLARGYVLLEDLGSMQFLEQLQRGGDPDALYGDALAALVRIQSRGQDAARTLGPYDAAVLDREMALMPEWFLARHLAFESGAEAQSLLRRTFDTLIAATLEQPRVLVHRDYHSRNLMVVAGHNPGIIDFQDALDGPVGYDLVSLLKDCYLAWPRARVEAWLREYRAALRRAGAAAIAGASDAEFLRWFDFVGLQRHIKVLGIFARLWYRDGKVGYLADLPLTLEYVRDTASRYGELQSFARWLEAQIVPRLAPATAAVMALRDRGGAR